MAWGDGDPPVTPPNPDWGRDDPPVEPEVPDTPPRVPEPRPDAGLLGSAADLMRGIDPAEQARVMAVSAKTGVPPSIVQGDPDGVERDAAPLPDWDGIASHFPTLASHIQHPENMARARDDVGTLAKLEGIFTGLWHTPEGIDPSTGAALPAPESGRGFATQRVGQGPESGLSLVDATAQAFDQGWRGLRASLEQTRIQLGLGPEWTQGMWGYRGLEARWHGPSARELLTDRPLLRADTEEERGAKLARDEALAAQELHARGLVADMWLGAVRASPFVLAAGFLSPLGMGGMAGLGVATTYGPLKKAMPEALDPTTREILAWTGSVGAGTALAVGPGGIGKSIASPIIRRVPAELLDFVRNSTWMPKLVAQAATRWGVQNAVAATGMATAGAVQDLTLQVARLEAALPTGQFNPTDLDLRPVFEHAAEAWKAGFKDFALLSAIHPGRRFLGDIGTSLMAAQEAKALRSAAAVYADSKLAERDPAAGEALADQMAGGASAYVTREKWDTYWREKNLDPRRQADLGDGGASYDTGGEYVVLPLGRYVARYATKKNQHHLLALAEDTMLSPKSRTPRAEREFQATQAEDERLTRIGRGQAFEDELRKVGDILRESGKRAGAPSEEVEAAAALTENFAATAALRTGLSVPDAALLAGLARFRIAFSEKGERAEELARDALLAEISRISPRAYEEAMAARNGDPSAVAAMERRSWFDPLTGLGSRAAFEERQGSSPAGGGWEVTIDANDLKAQDLFGGHATGDAFLKGVAEAMRAAAGPEHVLFRRGGDELHASGSPTKEAAQAFAQAVSARVAALPELAPGYKASVSIGIGPDVASSDAAMYDAKRQKVQEVGAFEGKRPETKAVVAAGRSFIAARDEPGFSSREPVITDVGGKPVTLVVDPPPPDAAATRIVSQQRPGAGDPAHYRLVESDSLVPSHLPDSFAPNPKYPTGVQERDYTGVAAEQIKVISGAKALDPTLLLANTPSPETGPPIIAGGDNPLVLGGNGRAMMLLRGLRDPANRERYQTELRARAAGLGIDPAQIATMKDPVLVRVLDEITAAAPQRELAAAVRRLNESLTQALSPRALAISQARIMGATTIRDLANLLAGAPDSSLRDLMREKPGAIVGVLRRDGIITKENQAEYVRGTNLSEQGKDRLEALFIARVIETTGRMEATPPGILQKIERIVRPLVEVEGSRPDLSQLAAVRGGLDLLNEARERGIAVSDVAGQIDMFNPAAKRVSPDAVAMADILQRTNPKALGERFRAWAEAANPQTTLFEQGRLSPEQIRAVLYGKARGAPLAQRGRGPTGGPRAYLRMQIDATGRPIDLPVDLFRSDPSSLTHEAGHAFSWAMHDLAMDPRGESLRPDYLRLIRWAGFESPEARLEANLERARLGARERTAAEETRLRDLLAKEEKIAHGFEEQFIEGKAPSKVLEPVFAQLRTWLVRVYGRTANLREEYRAMYGGELAVSDEIRAIFDRWLTVETETGKVARDLEGESANLLLTRLTPEDRAELERARAARQAEAEGTLYAGLLQAERRRDRTGGDLRASLRDDAKRVVDEEPVYRLLAYFGAYGRRQFVLGRTPKPLPYGPDLLDENGKPWRLDRNLIVETYGRGFLSRLPKKATTASGGVTADFLAERFGFENGEALVRALRTAPPRSVAVEARIDARLQELYPVDFPPTPGRPDPAMLIRAAVDAEFTAKAAEEALVATRILVRRVDPTLGARVRIMEDASARNASARRLLLESRIADAEPQRFLDAERRFGRRANELTAKALDESTPRRLEYAAQAIDAREAQLLNQALYREARRVQARMAGARATFLRAQSDDFRKMLGKATVYIEEPDPATRGTVRRLRQPYLERNDDLVDALDVTKARQGFDRARRFEAWLETQPKEIQDAVLARVERPRMLALLEKSRYWTDLAVSEADDLVAALEGNAALARLKGQLLLGKESRDFESWVRAIVGDIRGRFPSGGGVRRKEQAEAALRRILEWKNRGAMTLIRPEELYRELGPELYRVFATISDAELESRRLAREVAYPIVKAIDRLSRKERKFLRSRFQIEGEWYDGEAALVVALSWGNASNQSKLRRGEAMLQGRFRYVKGLSDAGFKALMDKLQPRHWDLVEEIWKMVGEAKWEEIAALEASETGLAPPKIEAQPFEWTMPDGTVRKLSGGYFPVDYDPRFSTAGQRMGERLREGLQALAFAPTYERAVTPTGHLIRRVEAFTRPVNLSLSPMARHIVNSMRDLAMRKALLQTREILLDGRIRDAVQEALGESAYRTLVDHWRDATNENAMPRGQAEWLSRWLQVRRTAVTGAVFAANIGLAIQNFANVLPAMSEVPKWQLTKAFFRFMVKRGEMIREIEALDPSMRERRLAWQNTIERAGRDLVGRQGRLSTLTERVREFAMLMMETTDLVTSRPVWWAAREHAMRPPGKGIRGMEEAGSWAKGLGMNEDQAIEYAGRIVRLTQSSYRFLDRSAFERHPTFRHFAMFYGYMNAMLSRFMATHADARLLWNRQARYAAIWRVAKGYAFLMASGVLADALVGKGPEDLDGDGEITASDIAIWTRNRALLFPASTLPVVGSILQQWSGSGITRDPSLVPYLRPIGSLTRALMHADAALTEDAPPDEALKALMYALETFGWTYGLPVVQFERTGDYLADITPDGLQWSPEFEQAGPLEAVAGIAWGPKRKGRLTQTLFGED